MSSQKSLPHVSVQEKLELYRMRKEHEKKAVLKISIFNQILNFLNNILNKVKNFILPDINSEDETITSSKISKHTDNDETHFNSSILLKNDIKSLSKIDCIVIALKILLWLILWKIFILLEFGAVFFVCSGFFFLWFNLYSGSKRKGPSAYSVFNPNCEEILGTYSAEKLEKELLYR